MIEKTQDTEWNNKIIYGECMEKCFPITKENAYGAIPLLGLVASCFAASIVVSVFDYSVRDGWFGVWFSIGFLIFAAVQAMWGFHVKNQRNLLSWMACKVVELLAGIGGIIWGFIGGPYMCGLIAPSICLLILLVIILHVGYSKYQSFQKPENNVFADQCLDKIITK